MKTSRLLVIIIVCCCIIPTLIGCSTQKVNAGQKEKLTTYIFADYPHYSSIDSLAEKADIIIEGKIVSSRVEEINILDKTNMEDKKLHPSSEIQTSKMVYTVYTVKVSDSYKGTVKPGEIVEVKQLGGEDETTVYISEDSVKFPKNKKYLMFLSTYENVPASLLNPIQGSYSYEEETLINKGKLQSVNTKNDLTLTIEDLEKIKNKYLK
ncbi:MAG: hypothetical protein M1489_00965 [Firmicutes bacterium]|nr:hypothetical protein [Bacillota bacterium]